MRGVNKVILVGNLGSDPDSRYMPSGGSVVSVSIATTDSWKDKNTGERQERTEWHRVKFFNRLAEIVAQYLRKGSQVYIEGSLRTNKWQAKDGTDRYTTEIIANEMQMLGSRQDSGTAPYNPAGAPAEPQPGAAPAPPAQPQAAPQPPASSGPPPGPEDFNDDIPF